MKKGANISKPHIKRKPPTATDVFEQIPNLIKSYSFEQN